MDTCKVFTVNEKAVIEARQNLPEQRQLELLAATFQALGEANRLKILLALSGRELCVCELGQVLEMSAPAVSHHLRRLKDIGLVKSRREGKMACYSLDDDHIETLLSTGMEHVEHRF